MKAPQFFCISGNISSGKTSTLKAIESLTEEFVVEYEPVDSINFKFTLKNFYKDPNFDNLFHLQMLVYQHYLEITLKFMRGIYDNKTVLVERSPIDTYFVFLEANKHLLKPNDYSVLRTLMARLLDSEPWRTSITILLEQKIETCVQRMNARDRKEERHLLQSDGITDYLTLLQGYYSDVSQLVEHVISVSEYTPLEIANQILEIVKGEETKAIMMPPIVVSKVPKIFT